MSAERPPTALLARRLGRTLAAGVAGGGLFVWLNLPLAWMLGAMVATTAASLGGAKLYIPAPLRSTMIAILGVLLGASFTPEVLDKAREWPLTIGCLLLYLGFLIGILFLYFRRIVGLDTPTAYFSAAPGGLSEMVVTGAAMGGDDRTIALIHASRVLLVVLTVPFWFRFMTGVAPAPSAMGPPITAIEWLDLAVLAACAIAGVVVGRLIRLPAYRLSGPHARERRRARHRIERIDAALGAGRGGADRHGLRHRRALQRRAGTPGARPHGHRAGLHRADARHHRLVRTRARASHRDRLAAHRARLRAGGGWPK